MGVVSCLTITIYNAFILRYPVLLQLSTQFLHEFQPFRKLFVDTICQPWYFINMEEREMRNETAVEKFIEKTIAARELLAMISAELDDHIGVHPDRVHWGHVGDANHVLESLRDIARFMGHAE